MIRRNSTAGVRVPSTLGVDPAATGRIEHTDVAIVGAGAAGLAAAVTLADAGIHATVISKHTLGDGSTAWAQGGLAAVVDPTDSAAQHVADTLAAGAGLCDPEAVRDLVDAAPAAIARLTALGAHFDTTPDGRLALGLEGGHHARRIVHAGGDASGAEVARTLAAATRRGVPPLRIVEHTLAVDAVLDADGGVTGLILLSDDGEPWLLRARAVVLATGGIGRLWATTTNPATATGDGLALALRAGALARDVEFYQFHPTVLAVPGAEGVLVSEAVRGEGARVVDADGTPIMAGVHPLGDLAPRDVVSATIEVHLAANGGDHVFLDGTHLGAQVWAEHFPTILAACRDHGIDPVTTPIPIRPAAHYHCGGIAADLDGRTDVPGLYAVGEVAATGVQGANRLASNSITEGLVAGDRCARLIAATLAELPSGSGVTTPTRAAGYVRTAERARIVAAVTAGAGVLRDAAGLQRLIDELGAIPVIADGSDPTPDDVITTNLFTVATVLARAALTRTESRGCHRRADHPATDNGWQRRIAVALDDGAITIDADGPVDTDPAERPAEPLTATKDAA